MGGFSVSVSPITKDINMAQDNPILQQAKTVAAGGSTKAATKPSDSGSATEQSAVSLVGILNATLADSATAIDATKATLQEGRTTLDGYTSQLKNSLASEAKAKQTIALVQDTAQMQAEDTANAIFAAAGGVENQVRLMSDLKMEGEHVADLQDKHADIMDDEFTGLFFIDNAINKVRATPTESALKEAQAQEMQTRTQITEISGAQDAFAKTTELTKRSVSGASIKANQTVIAESYKRQAIKQDIANVASNADMMKSINTANAQQASLIIQDAQLQASAESRKLSKMRIEQAAVDSDRATQRFNAEMPQIVKRGTLLDQQLKEATDPARIALLQADRTENLRQHKVHTAAREEMTTAVQRAQVMLNGEGNYESNERIEQGFASTVTAKKYASLAAAGSSSNPSMGADPAAALNFFTTNDPNGTAVVTPTLRVLKDVQVAQTEAYAKGAGIPKDQTTLNANFNAAVKTEMVRQAGNIKARDYSNAYQAKSLPTLEMSGALQSTKLYQEVLAAQGVKEIVPQDIVDRANIAMQAGTLSPEEFADGISVLFTAAANYNNTEQGGFERTGMTEYNQTSYLTYIESPTTSFEQLQAKAGGSASVLGTIGSFGGSFKDSPSVATYTKPKLIDLMDKTELTQLAVRLQSSAPVKAEPATTGTGE